MFRAFGLGSSDSDGSHLWSFFSSFIEGRLLIDRSIGSTSTLDIETG
jgi:hypothetical protein